MIKPAFTAISATCVVVLASTVTIEAAELRSFAYSAIQADKSIAPTKPGIPYALPKSKVVVRFNLSIEKQYVLTVSKDAATGDYTTSKSKPEYVMKVDPATNNTISIKLVDDPNLAFYLTSESGLLTDISDGTIKFFPESTRISQVGVQYEDKTAELIKGTVKLLGETVGIAAKAAMAFSSDGPQKLRIKEPVDGISIAVEKELDISAATAISIDREYKKLEEALAQRFNSLDKEALASGRLQKATLQLTVTRLPANPVTAESILSRSGNTSRIDGQKLKYYPGVIYRSPEASTLSLTVTEKEVKLDSPSQLIDADNRTLAEMNTRLPEAGRIGWIELSSKVFAKVHPVVDFLEDGSVKTYAFTSVTKVEELKQAMDQISQSAGSVVDQLKASKDGAKQAEQAKKQSAAQLAYDIVKFEGEETKLKEEVAELETKISSGAVKPEDKDSVAAQLRVKKNELIQLSERLEILRDQNIRVTP